MLAYIAIIVSIGYRSVCVNCTDNDVRVVGMQIRLLAYIRFLCSGVCQSIIRFLQQNFLYVEIQSPKRVELSAHGRVMLC